MNLLSNEEKSEIDKFYGSFTNRPNPVAPGRTTQHNTTDALQRLMSKRPIALRHTWDVHFGPHFLPDCNAAHVEVLECVLANISTMSSAWFPGTMGVDAGEYNLWVCEIGRRYRIIYDFIPRYHRLELFFMRQHMDAYDGPLRVVMPNLNVDPDCVAIYEDVIGESYKTDVEKDDLRRIIEEITSK